MAEEARRWTLDPGALDHAVQLALRIQERVRVREDRAYEADIEKAAQAIAFDDDRRGYEHANEAWEDLWENEAEQDAAGQGHEEPTREDYRQNARAALNAVFSDRGVEKE